LALAHQCARLAACNPAGLQATLPGPTGERNVYQVQARQRVLCLVGQQPSSADDLLAQLAAVLAVGGQAVWDAHHPAATRLHAQLPATVQARIQLAADWAQAEADAALCHGQHTDHLHTAQVLAQRSGPIVTLTTLPTGSPVPLARLVAERSISTNTAAAGGNASLMTLGA
jgi:RHH-type proline utilization regulon transcriptional repressor/proline dehydrogenase/delta 1-pyrroline-5-carboxylate dehydrogenase